MAQTENRIITDGIATLRRLSDFLPDSEKNGFISKLNAIEARYNDKDFYLAVIGNFNAGKSTFLNAILNMDILSTGMLPTTAIPTYIRWNRDYVLNSRMKLGRVKMPGKDSPCIQVMMSDGSTFFVDGLDDSGIKKFQSITGITLPQDDGEKIDCLTTTNELASKVKNIYLSFPARKGFENFCLIDTPGINPQTMDESNTVHILNTQSVLREKADCAMLLYQAQQAMAWNTKEFISKNAAHLAGNAIVFLTYWDAIPHKERGKILAYVAERLSQDFAQKSPIVFPISASKARDYQSGADKSPECCEYCKSFSAAVSDVMEMLHVRREAIVMDRLLKLIGGLTDNLQSAIRNSQKDLEEQAEILRKNSWQSVIEDVSVLQITLREKINSSLPEWESSIRTRTAMKINSACNDVCARIDSASDLTTLKKYSEKYYPEKIAEGQTLAWHDVQETVFADIKHIQIKFRNDVEKCLQEHSRYLGAMTLSGETSSQLSGLGNPLVKSKDAGDDALEALMFWGGVILSFVNPIAGIFTIITTFFFSDYLLNKKKNDIKAEIQKEAAKVIAELSKTFCTELRSCIDKVTGWSENILDTYKESYSALYEQAERDYEKKKAANEQELRKRTNALCELESLSKSVKEGGTEKWTDSKKRSSLKNVLINVFRNLFRWMQENFKPGGK